MKLPRFLRRRHFEDLSLAAAVIRVFYLLPDEDRDAVLETANTADGPDLTRDERNAVLETMANLLCQDD
jgi:hypothetical protein